MSLDHDSTVSLSARDATKAAYELALDEANALAASEVVPATTNTADAVVRVLAAVPGLRLTLAQAHKSLPLFDAKTIDRFERNANALSFAQSRFVQSRSGASAELATLSDDAQRALTIAFGDLQALANRGLVDPARVSSIKQSATTRESLPVTIGAVVQLMGELREKTGDRLLMTETEQNALAQLAAGLREALATRVVSSADNDALDTRNRVFTLLYRDFLELRRAVEYLRFYEDDADEVLPSLFTRSKRKPKNATDNESGNANGNANGNTNNASSPTAKRIETAPVKPLESGAVHAVPQEDPFGAR